MKALKFYSLLWALLAIVAMFIGPLFGIDRPDSATLWGMLTLANMFMGLSVLGHELRKP